MLNRSELKRYQGIIFDFKGDRKLDCSCYSMITGKKLASGNYPGCGLILSLTPGVKDFFTFQPNGSIRSVKKMVELFEEYCNRMSPKEAYIKAGWEINDLIAAGEFN